MEKILSKSISELEGWKWKGNIPREDDWSTEYRFYMLHDKPIEQLDLSDIYFLILENSGLQFIVPIGIKKLTENLFLEVENYPGDLLCSLFLINNEPNYWKSHPKEKQELIDLYAEQKKNLGSIDASDEIIQKIKEAYKEFLNK